MSDTSAFEPDADGLGRALALLLDPGSASAQSLLPDQLPEHGVGAEATLDALVAPVLAGAQDLGAPGFFAHMDPPTPWVTWAVHQWTASRNQNLLHPDVAPAARDVEARVVEWVAPVYEMTGGHMTPGSTVANLTALWAAREAGARTVVATRNAHLSVAKGAHLLGMEYRCIEYWSEPGPLDDVVAVITAGATSTGEIEPLDAAAAAPWRHVDAAWAGPLRLSERHRGVLDGIETADSVSISAHKWLFQPKESALVLFADVGSAHRSVSFGADYLAIPNVGVLGSHGAVAAPLMATLMAYGRQGVAAWIDRCMAHGDHLADLIDDHPLLERRTAPQSGVVNWRRTDLEPAEVHRRLPPQVVVSTTTIDDEPWLRSVAANPMADAQLVVDTIVGL